MKISHAATAFSGALLSASLLAIPTTAAHAADCRAGTEVREMIAAFVADLQDDVKSQRARSATQLALVESMKTFRGERADNAAERRELGQQISELARRQSETENRVEGRALATAILALTEQRERGSFTAEEHKELRGSIADLKRVLVNRADSAAEGEEIAAAIRQLVQQFTCAPS